MSCVGHGCPDCDGTGKRYRTTWRTTDGVVVSVTTSRPLSPDARAAWHCVVERFGRDVL